MSPWYPVPILRISKLTALTLLALTLCISIGDADGGDVASSIQLEKVASFNQKARAFVLGDVEKVLQGTVTRDDLVRLRLSEIVLGLGLGSFSDEKELGDVIILGGKAFVKSTNPFRNFKTESQSHLLFSAFSLGIHRDEKADAIYTFKSQAGVSVSDLYKKLIELYPNGFAVEGLGIFKSLKGSALKSSPIQGESIMGVKNAAKYMHPTETFQNQKAAFFGVVVSPTVPKEHFSDELLAKAFYQNPSDTGSQALKSHTHFATSQAKGKLPAPFTAEEFHLRVKKADLVEARHLLTQSELTEAILLVYDLSALETYPSKTP